MVTFPLHPFLQWCLRHKYRIFSSKKPLPMKFSKSLKHLFHFCTILSRTHLSANLLEDFLHDFLCNSKIHYIFAYLYLLVYITKSGNVPWPLQSMKHLRFYVLFRYYKNCISPYTSSKYHCCMSGKMLSIFVAKVQCQVQRSLVNYTIFYPILLINTAFFKRS